MSSSSRGALARLVAGGVAASVAAAGMAVGLAAPANAAVSVSGSVIDPAGNYASGYVAAYTLDGSFVTGDSFDNGAFDLPLADGSYKLEFDSSAYASEWYRDKVDEASADVVTVAGAAQVLPAWTVDRSPSVTGVVRTSDGRGIAASIDVFNAATGVQLGRETADRSGAFRVSEDVPVKLFFSGYDNRTRKNLASEWFNDKISIDAADVVTPTAAGADLGVVTLAPGGSVSGRVTTEAGAPIHRVQACASSGGCDWTDAGGVYLIEGVRTGTQTVSFRDPIGEFVPEYWNNASTSGTATPVVVAPGQAVTGIDAALAAAPVVAPNGVDVRGTVRDELGGVGVGYPVNLYTATPDPRDSKVVATTYSNRAGQYFFTELDRIGGVTQFKIEVDGTDGDGGAEQPREDGDFARRTTWSGNKLDFATAATVTATSGTLDFTLPVAGGVSGSVTSDAGGVPENADVIFTDSDNRGTGSARVEVDGTYDERTLWAGQYTVAFGAYLHVTEWWKNALPEDALAITVKPGQVVTGISASLSKDVKAVDRPEILGDAWVGRTLRVDAGRWNTQAASRFTYEWLVGGKVVATGASLKVAKKHLGKKITARVTNDAGFAQGQALTKASAKVGLQPRLKAKVSARSAVLTLKVKSLKAKKVKASVVVYEQTGTTKNGEPKLKKIGKGTITGGKGTVRFSKPLGKGKHRLVFSLKGKGKVGSGDLEQKVKIKR
ncbi:carboxypeptidase regulatory-like domain-containing protein [Nocardioides oleivorans]|uniref:Carboxypeptidase regulatory-like domain-containing protein n=1 Tax=Nocardioides oleivorans TaxID=273676 RepID=A0A4V1RL54_9ACTN|nr:carboxypeptidase regulatory-like domain-containing protein [Nocardioides oleivorans]RYB94592.1 carboxypeptidase regulatory-like domain-containing protein [Nocardioides oleivorans]